MRAALAGFLALVAASGEASAAAPPAAAVDDAAGDEAGSDAPAGDTAITEAPADAAEGPPQGPPACPEGACAELRVRLRRAGDRSPIVGATVLIFPAPEDAAAGETDDPPPILTDPPWVRRGESDERGELSLAELPPGRVAIEVIAPDFVRRRVVVTLAAGEARTIKSFVRAGEAALYRTTVESKRARPTRPAPFRRGLAAEEARTLPGSQGDPLRALQSLPGFGRTPLGLGLLVLRGASPNQSQVFVGEHPVPRAFHLSGLSAILPADAIARVDAIPSNFDVAYGNASGGVVVMEPRAGARDGVHGSGTLDLLGAGALAQGPLGRGSFVIGGRRAHLDLPLRVVAGVNPQAPVIIPTYYDYQAFADLPLPRRASLHVGFLGAGDRFAIRAPEDFEGERRLLFDLHSGFHRLDLAYRKTLGATSVLLSPSLRFDRQRLDVGASSLREDAWVTSYRAEVQHAPDPALTFVFGADGLITRAARVSSMAAPSSEEEGGDPTVEETRSHELRTAIGFYSAVRVRLRRLDLDPGVRVASFLVEDRDRGEEQALFAADPRINGVLRLGERWALRGGVGLYSQPARPSRSIGYGVSDDIDTGDGHVIVPTQILAYFDPTRFSSEVGDVRLRRALQASAGASYRLPAGVTFEVLGFVRDQDNGLPLPRRSLYRSRTLAYGGEALIRRELGRRFYGWIAYTLLWVHTDRWADADAPPSRVVDDFDQRHNLVVAGSARLPRGWRIGGRFRLVTGTPYTPVVGAIQRGNSFDALYGATNSDRFPLFVQLDLRVDRQWILRRVVVSAYLDLLNVTNAANTEAFIYSNDFRSRAGGVALPILPALGLRIEG